jgi:hypothetical protein
VYVNPPVDPAVTAATVMSTVAGEHTAAGLETKTVGEGLTVTVTGLMS